MSRRNIWSVVSTVAVLSLVATLAIFAQGFDVVDAPPESTDVWVIQNESGQRYARVNSALAELDSVNTATNPSSLLQASGNVLLFTDGDSRVAAIDAANPQDIDAASPDLGRTPGETTDIQTDGKIVAYLASAGTVWLQRLTADGQQSASPAADSGLTATAMSLSPTGLLALYSATEGSMRVFDTATSSFIGQPASLSPAPRGDHSLQLTWAGDRWALLDPVDSRLWVQARTDPIAIDAGLSAGALLQSATTLNDLIVIAQDGVLVTIDLASGVPTASQPATGMTARPTQVGASVFAAWLTAGTAGGMAVNAVTGEAIPLSYAGLPLETEPHPVIASTGSRAVVNDTASGWAWNLPSGALVAGSQDWSLLTTNPSSESTSADTANVTQPRPPVAQPDSFGVRAGSTVTLPVLLNDYDANGDVLAIDPSSLTQPEFGRVDLINQSQSIVMNVPVGASGRTSFEYRVSDGTTIDGLLSEPARVTITVVPEDENSAPAWCSDIIPECVAAWPSPSVAPGGTLDLNVMNGWVDPQGDQFFASRAALESGSGVVNISPTGRLVYQHVDASLTTTEVVAITITMSDVRGATATRSLTVTVTSNPRLVATSFAAVTAAGEPVTIDVSGHVSGGAHPATLVSASLATASTARTSVVSSTKFTFVSPSPGDFDVTISVTDGVSVAVMTARVIVAAPGSRPLALAPVTVFLTPGSDQVVDVFTAATNPEKHVLMLDSAVATPSPGANLFVNVIDASRLRIRGSTATELSGQVGTIDLTLSDGTGNAAKQATGQVIVYVLPSPDTQTPIALDDTATLRVNAQIDVDVLANDLGPAGSTILVDPKSIVPDCAANLVFASGDIVRVLAPGVPGVYRCAYTVSVVGNPSLTSTAVLTLNVLGDDGNKPPLAPTLFARAQAGAAVDIPVPLTALDPDGDAVWLVSVGTPTTGFAAVSANGQSVTYTSSASASGQDSLAYTVRDARGGSASGVIRVGLLGTAGDPGPITTTDYVDITAASGKTITIDPTRNDVDPLGKGLALDPDSVVPDARPGTPPFDTSLAALEKVDGNKVTVRAPDTPSVLAYRYSVVDGAGNVSVGLLLVRGVVKATPSYPRITDTYLAFSDRARLITGIDVVTNKVAWTGGDVSSLKLDLWPGSAGFTASGSSILGQAPDQGAVVAFSLSGVDYSGNEVVSYGFLRIPPLAAAILTLKPGIEPVSVREEDSVTFNVADYVATPPGTSFDLVSDGVRAFGSRANATCAVANGTSATYVAGSGSPWSDGCVVEVSLRGSGDSTRLLIPVTVVPLEPEPELSDRALEISPGAPPTNSKIFDLTTMTTWVGNDNLASLEYAVTYSGTSFQTTLAGSKLTITANDNAVPGTRETIEVRITNHPKTPPANIRLTVGPAPTEGPIGGFGVLACSATEPTCALPISALTGTFNPYQTSLTFAPFGFPDPVAPNAVTCGQATLTAAPDSITATWPAGNATVGASCASIPYVVVDAQGRTALGSLSFDLAGFPGTPSSIVQSGYTETSATLRIEPGDAGNASPALRGYHLYADGGSTVVADCPVEPGLERFAVECAVTGLIAYEKHSYRAVPYNDLGESASSVTANDVYAYRAPLFGQIDSASGVYSSTLTTTSTGAVSVTVTPAADPSVESYVVVGDGAAGNTPAGRVVRPLNGSFASFTVIVAADAGAGSGVTVSAVGAVPPPVGASGQTSSEHRSVDVPGAPSLTVADTFAEAAGSGWNVTMSADANANGGDSPEFLYLLWPTGVSAPECSFDGTTMSWSASSPGEVQSQRTTDTSVTFTGLGASNGYESLFCVTNGFGLDQMRGATVGLLTDPAPGTFTYVVAATPFDGAYLAELDAGSAPAGLIAQFRDGEGPWTDTFSSDTFGANLNVRVRYCQESAPDTCSPGNTLVTPSTPDRSWQVRVTGWALVNECVFDQALVFDVTGDGLGTFDSPNWQLSTDIPPIYLDSTFSIYDTVWDAALGAWVIPSGSPDPAELYATIVFSSTPQISGLDPLDVGPIPITCSAP